LTPALLGTLIDIGRFTFADQIAGPLFLRPARLSGRDGIYHPGLNSKRKGNE
jgi:hypothetical protein